MATTVFGILTILVALLVFGEKNPHLQVSATKSMTGHLLGAAGAIEAIACIMAIKNSVIPPTINLEDPDPEIPAGLTIVKDQAREMKIEVAMSNTFGFGGHNGIVIFKKFI